MDRDVDVHAGVDPVGPLVLQLLVGADVEVAVLREHVLQALVLDEAVAADVPAVVALDAAVAGLALGAGLGRTAVQAAADFAQDRKRTRLNTRHSFGPTSPSYS